MHTGVCNTHCKTALPEQEPTAHQLFGLFPARTQHGTKRVLHKFFLGGEGFEGARVSRGNGRQGDACFALPVEEICPGHGHQSPQHTPSLVGVERPIRIVDRHCFASRRNTAHRHLVRLCPHTALRWAHLQYGLLQIVIGECRTHFFRDAVEYGLQRHSAIVPRVFDQVSYNRIPSNNSNAPSLK